MTWAVLGAALLLVLMVAVAVWAYQTATRLDRLHVRYDLSWQALDAALARRAVVSRAVAADAYGSGERCWRLTALADAAEQAPRAARETAENELSAELAMVDTAVLGPALIAELADAEARVLLARRFHNDAVRDTLALRLRRPVRWLRLGGRAPLPTYFEIAERGHVSDGDEGVVTLRTSARVVLLDEQGCVLLFCGSDPARDDVGAHPSGGSPWVARRGRGRRCSRPRPGRCSRRRDCAPPPRTWSGRCGDATRCWTSTTRWCAATSCSSCTAPGGSTRRPRATPRSSIATSMDTAGVTPTTSPRW